MELCTKKQDRKIHVKPGDTIELNYRREFGDEVLFDDTVVEDEVEKEMILDTFAIFQLDEDDEISEAAGINEGFAGVMGRADE